MDALGAHVVIVGGPEAEEELLAIVLDDGEAVPLFDSIEEAEEFLNSTGDFGTEWKAREVSAGDLIDLLEYQDEEVPYVALSPPPERLEGGMEVQVLDREVLISLLRSQVDAEPDPERKGFWGRLLGR
ncbi:MAG: hypothetical protein M3397_00515 [Actinomycetota bacterium]|jgi:hypothetical protein|nr:hypothetical protein [Rubrobacter sp.]MDQ3238600.1 hypothetical protein [Actinomycetota bacterium]MDQ3566547.1 hypothetical protein [Actinomycetota bacterium]